MNRETKIVPINELPSASYIEDDDILIKSNFENTEKVTADQLQEYVNRKRKHADWKETDQKSDAYIENKPTSLSADGGNADTVNGHTVESDVPPNAKFTDTIYTHPNSGVTASTYKSVTVDSKGHVTGGTNPTTLDDFGITDAASKTELGNEVTRSTNKENELETKKANLESPTFTGIPKVPTASTETNTTQAASTAFVHSSVNSHNSSTSSHSDIREFIEDLDKRLNALADSDDTTLDQMSEIVAYIKSNKSLIEDITTTKVNVADIIDNLTSTSTDKPLSARQGKLLNDLISSLKSSVGTKVENISGDSIIGVVKTGNNYSVTHKDITRNNTTSSISPAHGNSFTAVKSILTDNKGHITSVDTTTVTLPNEQDLSSSNIHMDNGNTLEEEIDSLKKSVSDGKTKVAGAITAKGVTTAANATFDIIAGNITKIQTGTDTSDANATAAQLFSGYTAYVKGKKIAGAVINRGAWTANTVNGNNVAIPAGYHNGSGYVSGAGAYNAGVTAADNRANPNSVNYKTGYNNGYAAGQNAVSVMRKEVTRQVQCHSGGGEGSPRIELVTFDMDFPHRVVGLENYWIDGQGQKFGIHGFDISGNRITLHLGNTISWFDAVITLRAMIVGY